MGKQHSDERASSGGYGGYYGGYYYGEGYGGGYADAAVTPNRGIKDYLLMLRERIWWLVTTVFVVFLGVALYTFNAPELYRSAASIRILRSTEEFIPANEIAGNDVRGAEDLQTQIGILSSERIVRLVEERLQSDNDLRRRFLAPYEVGVDLSLRGPIRPFEILMSKRSVMPERLSLIVRVAFSHPDREVAAEVANLFAEEYISFNKNQDVEVSVKAMEEILQKANEYGENIRLMELKIADFKEKYGTVSVEARQDIDNQELIQLKTLATNANREFDIAKTHYDQIQEARENNVPLYELGVIGGNDRVRNLLNSISSYKIDIAALSKKYGPKHPKMIAVREALDQSEAQLNLALSNAATALENEFRRAKSARDLAEKQLASKEVEMIELDRLRPEYNKLIRDLEINRGIYNQYFARYNEAMALANTEGRNARIIDRALPSARPFKPNTVMNLSVGLVMGLGMGFGLVFLLAILDDKVKTAFDIESSIGLPLIGIVPRISIVDALEKARVVADNLDKHSVEAFRAVHSTLKLNEESRNAKVVLTTSTIPSEGKSFVSTNLAFTFANHGERTLVLDADLRMPNVGKSLELANRKGILQVLDGSSSLDDVIIKDFIPGLDVLVSGGRSKNPTQHLSSEKFENLIHELRSRYDRIVIDSPPLAPVSDALNILPLVDGVIYVIRFNMVKRKTASINVRRLRESNVPVLGAILNNINTSVAGYYYSHYYEHSYRNYYLGSSGNSEGHEGKERSE